MTEKKADPANRLDRLIGYLFPERGLRRAIARVRTGYARRYEGAAAGRRTDTWRASGTSANTEILTDLVKLRDRHRDLVRNNPWVTRAVQAIVANVVGYGITAKLVSTSDKNTKSLNSLWKGWAESTECDADGRHDIYGLQALIMRCVAESGEMLIRRRWRQKSDGLTVPMQLQLIEPDYLDLAKNEILPSGNKVVQGVEFNFIGQRVAYWLFPDHPGDTLGKTGASKPVPSADVLHIYRQDRIGQVRGVPWGAAALLTLRDLDDYEDAYLFRQKIANLFVGAVHDTDSDTPANAESLPLPETMEPGAFPLLPPGKEITFGTPPSAGDYGPFTKDVLLRVAACYGITYAALTGDLSSVNFSSGRMGWLEMGRNVDLWRWSMLIPSALTPIAEWFGEAANLGSGLPKTVTSEWSPPRRDMINPAVEIPAIVDGIRAGVTTLPQAHRESGMDSDAMLQEIADTNAKLDKLGLVLDCDPRKVSNAGLTQARPAGTTIPSPDVNA